ncbi:MAG: FmdB family zinc ribbon protein [Thermodesulfobacteriota bacterium]
MPIYEYKCKKCEEIFEMLQGFNDKPAVKCENCGGRVERLISLSAFHLKGSGWYETDYGKKKITQEKELKNQTDTELVTDKTEKAVDTGGAHTALDAKEKLDSIKTDTKKAKTSSKKT